MRFFWSKKKRDKASLHNDILKNASKEDILNLFMQQQSPSGLFASGAIFDISRQGRDAFIEALSSNDVFSLLNLFASAYSLFLENPQVVGFIPEMVNKDNNDTNPNMWNADIFKLQNDDYAALLFMPIQHDIFMARIVGIVFGNNCDGYYYCMLNKDEERLSDVIRNKAMEGVEKIGEVKGTGFELMYSFLNFIKEDYYRSL